MNTDPETHSAQPGWINELKRFWWVMLIPLSGVAIGLYEYARMSGEPGLLEYGLAAQGVVLAVVALYYMSNMFEDYLGSY